MHIPGACYHVIGRGLERRYIFEDAEDKRDFLSRFGRNLLLTGSQCLAAVAMSSRIDSLQSCAMKRATCWSWSAIFTSIPYAPGWSTICRNSATIHGPDTLEL